MSVDTWTQRLHAEAFADDPPCANCQHSAEVHDLANDECADCQNEYPNEIGAWCLEYCPDDPRNHAPDDWEDE